MTRGNQRDKAREAAAKKAASHKQPNAKSGIELRRTQEDVAKLMRDKQAEARKRLAADQLMTIYEANRRKQAEEAHERQMNIDTAAAAKKAKAQAKADDEPVPVVSSALVPDSTPDPTQAPGQTPAIDSTTPGVLDIEALGVDDIEAETVPGEADAAAVTRKLNTLVVHCKDQTTKT